MESDCAEDRGSVRHLDAPPIPTQLFRNGLDTLWRSRFRISSVRLGKSVLFFSWTVTDTLERAISIRRPRLVLFGADTFPPVFVLPGCPARLADVHK
jgi:hypothetical protein